MQLKPSEEILEFGKCQPNMSCMTAPESTTRCMNHIHPTHYRKIPKRICEYGRSGPPSRSTRCLTARNHHHLIYPCSLTHPPIHPSIPILHKAQLSSLLSPSLPPTILPNNSKKQQQQSLCHNNGERGK